MKRYTLTGILMSVLLVISFVMPMSVFAEDTEYSLSVQYVANGIPMPGTLFTMYHALDGSGKLTEDFADYDIEIGDFHDSEAMSILSDTLYAYAVRDKLIPETAGMTDAKGEVRFDNLKNGVYLVVGTTTKVDDVIYTIKPCIISLPYIDENENRLNHVVLNPKYATLSTSIEAIDCSVMKVWKDNENLARPKEIEVQLLQDGEIIETIFLNKENDWKHTWKKLDPDSDWLVTEAKVPTAYKVSITRNDTAFVITNTFSGNSSGFQGEEDPTDPSETDKSTEESETNSETDYSTEESETDTDKSTTTKNSSGSSSSSKQSSTSGKTGTSTNTNNAQISTLPQTGQLKWPIPVLFITGMLIFLAGIVDYNLDNNEKT